MRRREGDAAARWRVEERDGSREMVPVAPDGDVRPARMIVARRWWWWVGGDGGGEMRLGGREPYMAVGREKSRGTGSFPRLCTECAVQAVRAG